MISNNENILRPRQIDRQTDLSILSQTRCGWKTEETIKKNAEVAFVVLVVT